MGGRTEPGTVLFDRYRVVRRIAAGGMGTVFEARDLVLDQPVALKRVSYAALPDDLAAETRERTMREARNAAQLRGDPHVVAIYDVEVDDDDVWLVLEYLPSRSLAELTAGRTRIDVRTAAGIGAPVARGLAAAHGRGITHRDVKPGNILIATDDSSHPPGTTKLTDFGISHAEGESTLTATGQVSGTPAYMAREVARGEDATPASDVFSLGATLYAAVEGIGPFGPQSNPRAMVYRVANDPIRPPEVAGPLGPVLLAMMDDEPSRRPDAATVAGWLGAVATQGAAPDGASGNGSGVAPSGVAPSGGAPSGVAPAAGAGASGRAAPGARSDAPGPPSPPVGQWPPSGRTVAAPARGAGPRTPGSSTPVPSTAMPVAPGAAVGGPPGRPATGRYPEPGRSPAAQGPGVPARPAPPPPGPPRGASQPPVPRPAPEASQEERTPESSRSHRTSLQVGGAVGAVVLVVLAVLGVRFLTAADDDPAPVAASPRAITGDPRAADPCPLLDPAALGRFGGVTPSAGSEPSGCRLDVTASDGKPAQLTAFFGRGVTVDGGTQQVGDLTVARGRSGTGDGSDARSCTHAIGLPDGNQAVLRAFSFSAAVPPCDLADAGLDSAVAALQRDGIRYDAARTGDSVLARADACAALDPTDLGRVGVGAAAYPGYASWSCSWGSADSYASVTFGGTTGRSGVAGTPGPPVAGRASYVDGGPGMCSVVVAHREAPGPDDLLETVTTTVRIPGADRDRTCQSATDLANTAENRLPSD